MPAIKHYVVTQTRQVKVWANTLEGAVEIAQSAFQHGQIDNNTLRNTADINHCGNPTSMVEETHITVEKE